MKALSSTLLECAEVYNGLWRWLAHWPTSRCPLCAAHCRPGRFCAACAADLPCRAQPSLAEGLPGLETVYAACRYRYPLTTLIQAAKFRSDQAALHALAGFLAETVSDCLPEVDLLVPVPLGAGRYLRRGYNQAVELSRPLAKRTGARFVPELLYRCKGGPAQSALPPGERRRNMRGAFAATRRIASRHAVLVDDVMTSGATLVAAAAALRTAGIERISAVVLASAWAN